MIKKETLRESVRDYLRDMILLRKMKPKDRLVETKIAKELGVSQSPVREAIRELEMIGFIDTIPYYGSFVHSFTKKEIRDNYRIRSLLEAFAIEEAIKNLDEDEMNRIKLMYQALKDSYQADNPKQNTESDIEFHHEIIRATQIPMLERAWRMLNMAQLTFLTTSTGDYPKEEFKRIHEELFNSIMSRDIGKACDICREHYDLAAETAVSWVDKN